MRRSWYRNFWTSSAETNPLFVIALADEHEEVGFYEGGERDTARILDLLEPVFSIDGKRVLELGCGLGRMTGPLADRAYAVVAVDIAFPMLRDMPSRLPAWPARAAHIHRVHVPVGALPIRDQSVDAVFSYIVLHHLPTTDLLVTTIAEMARVVRPGGRVAFQVCNWRPTLRITLGRIRRLQQRSHRAFRMRYASVRSVRRAVDAAGLRIVEQNGVGTAHLWTVAERPPATMGR